MSNARLASEVVTVRASPQHALETFSESRFSVNHCGDLVVA